MMEQHARPSNGHLAGGQASLSPRTPNDLVRILIVGDDAAIRANVTDTLCDEGYETFEMTTNAHLTRGLDTLGADFRLVLVDPLNGEDSIQCVRYLRERGLAAPVVVFLNADSKHPFVDQIGAVEVLKTPIETGALIKLVGRFVRPVA